MKRLQGVVGRGQTRGGRTSKRQRQQAILELVDRMPLSTQEEIRAGLERLGVRTTQPTVSRDLEELGLVRVRGADGQPRYAPASEAEATGARSRLRALIQEFLTSVEPSGNLVVITTSPGAASTLAESLDHAGVEGLLGTVAGDNTILAVAREGVRGRDLARRIREMGGLA